MKLGVVPVLSTILLFSACSENRIYDDHIDLKNQTWLATEKPEFEFRIGDIGKGYNIDYTVRNSLVYPYARLFVNYSLHDSVGNILEKKLVAHYLFDQKTGEPQGNSGLGDVYDHRFTLLSNYKFKMRGKYHIQLEQFMRTDSLPGIMAVGVQVEAKE